MKVLVVVVLFACLWHVCLMEDSLLSLKAIARSNWEFSNSLYAAMSKSTKASDNILFSPLSVHLVLTMCYLGAGGETAAQISSVLRLPDSTNLIKYGYPHLLKALPDKEDVTLEVANIIFPAERFPIEENFTETVKEVFKSELEHIDYTNPSKAAYTINGWVGHVTHKKITYVVSGDSLSQETAMVLVNVVYFKGLWETAFAKKLTTKSPFHVNRHQTVPVDMMHCKKDLRYEEYEDIGASVLELPYRNKTTSLVIVLPNEVDGLAGVEAKLQGVNLKEVLTSRTVMTVHVALPRFSLKLSANLNAVLKELGIKDMFKATANFSGVAAKEGLFVSSVRHNTLIEVNEAGTEAAAVTSAEVTVKAFVNTTIFIVDRPFLFALVSRRAGVVLFMGRFTGPRKESPNTFKSAAFQPRSNSASSLVRGRSWLWGLHFYFSWRRFQEPHSW